MYIHIYKAVSKALVFNILTLYKGGGGGGGVWFSQPSVRTDVQELPNRNGILMNMCKHPLGQPRDQREEHAIL